ncbi:hypothetical protein G7Z17_g13649 [Cylindrodendrum hubeiense]|uniref:Integral membrane protein n=1 Tax=Cylindrodendrum hubeiense TaxID=595255 RepID=A0A9P5H0L7_9HYPO|nr:hypothetical protein G7Z17_g13649 [Cylindrodendrum hubeiense]
MRFRRQHHRFVSAPTFVPATVIWLREATGTCGSAAATAASLAVCTGLKSVPAATIWIYEVTGICGSTAGIAVCTSLNSISAAAIRLREATGICGSATTTATSITVCTGLNSPVAQATTPNDYPYYSPPSQPTVQSPEQKEAAQETQGVITASNDHHYNTPPQQTRPETQVAQGAVATSSNHHSTSTPSNPPAQKHTTEGVQNQGAQNRPIVTNDHHYYPPSQEQPANATSNEHSYIPPPQDPAPQATAQATGQTIVQTTDSDGHYYYPPPQPLAAQKQTTQVSAAHITTSNDHYSYPRPLEPIEQKQNTQAAHEVAVSSSDNYYYPPPPPPGPPPSSQRLQEQQTSPAIVYTESTPSIPTTATVDPPNYNPFASIPPPQQDSNPRHSESTDSVVTSSGPLRTQDAVLQSPLAVLSTQMDTLNLRAEEHSTPLQSSRVVGEDDRPRPPPPIIATGTPNDVVPFCPESRGVDYSLYWYHLADMPKYLICTRCHADHIQGTSLASHFVRVKQPDDVVSTCGFWRPRVKEILWPQAVQSNDFSALREFMKKRLDIPPCSGRVARTAAEGVKWYGMTKNEIDGYVGCEACYEDRVVGTTFQSNFTPFRQQGADDKWTCDLALPYLSLAVVKMAKLNDWAGFVAAAAQRIALPECEGKKVEASSRNWYLARRKLDEMHVCEACYLDKIALTRFESEFERHIPATGFDAFMENLGKSWTCNLANGTIPMVIALDAAIYQRDFMVFWNAAKVITGLVPCTQYGIIRGNWWTLAGGCDGLSVCEACHAGVLQTTGTAQFFEPVQRDREATIVCNFCITSPRFGQFISKYGEAQDRSVFSYYTESVKKLAGVPTCPRIKSREKGTWWGYQEALFCQDCFMSFVADTALGDSVPIKGESDDRHQICQIWSPRMRNMWLQACAAGAPGSAESQASLDEFQAFGKRRLEVYNATVPRIDFIRGMKELKMMNAMHQGMLSVMYGGMNSFASVAGTTDGNLHGNSSLGWYETENGATGAQMLNNMQSGMADANRADEWVQMAHLQAMWSEVE